ncbi:(R)-mandelonitrile lyase [Cohaesibacter haloalkalitolerans]|uniref:(R)-mandelonitrile lyase n=1 Tax=Cohaesibacter haloalkalitolerans TaxID=1162980 RepID=UPI000E64B564|nr:cupin domain-containing protein [uncultured Cohaesibacter sp.]
MFKKSLITLTALIISTGAFAQGMEKFSGSDRKGVMAPEQNFTGTAYVEMIFENKDPFVVNAGKVTFLPNARSNWHTHPAGQMLVVTEGRGWVQEEGKERLVMAAGDVIWCPPGVKHWHGATDSSSVTHYAIQQFEEGKNVDWMEAVTDAQYNPVSAD